MPKYVCVADLRNIVGHFQLLCGCMLAATAVIGLNYHGPAASAQYFFYDLIYRYHYLTCFSCNNRFQVLPLARSHIILYDSM